MAYEINKPTLHDFINDPNSAMRAGYYPDFMSCLALKASYFNLSEFNFIKTRFIEIFREEAILFPLALFCCLIHILYTLTIPLFFPVWALICWARIRPKFRKYHEKMKKHKALYVRGVENKD